jgi:hypothetical protein
MSHDTIEYVPYHDVVFVAYDVGCVDGCEYLLVCFRWFVVYTKPRHVVSDLYATNCMLKSIVVQDASERS